MIEDLHIKHTISDHTYIRTQEHTVVLSPAATSAFTNLRSRFQCFVYQLNNGVSDDINIINIAHRSWTCRVFDSVTNSNSDSSANVYSSV